MEINRIIWLEDIAEKLRWKHNVEDEEVLEVLENRPKFQYKEAGYREGEDVFAAFGQTKMGRYLSVFFVYTQDKRAIIVSARDMSAKERAIYVK
ncbi:MAG: hypothetical protein ETSY2_00425 [Candidatus Entotheonella gemina]|uniref:BrnT family toxin n=1 Tax=Candidatus Entotheonella gemina TaxID=1429439 RepID=W4MHW6_9BACT|nr:MAG: hypothetical protein ETSY2_00425 [Candidatus Entotheonella gemina]